MSGDTSPPFGSSGPALTPSSLYVLLAKVNGWIEEISAEEEGKRAARRRDETTRRAARIKGSRERGER